MQSYRTLFRVFPTVSSFPPNAKESLISNRALSQRNPTSCLRQSKHAHLVLKQTFSTSFVNMAPNEVDKTIHPHATGAALETAKQHEAEKPLKLYAGWFCPFVQRSWITLNEKKTDYQYIEINPYHKDPEFLKLNPRGLVPTLAVPVPAPRSDDHVTNGTSQAKQRKLKPLYESIVIAEYLDEHFSNTTKYGPKLLPAGNDELAAYERAICRLWIDHISSRIVPSFYRFLQHTPEKDSQYTISDVRSELLGHIKTFVRQLLEMDAQRDSLGEAPGPWFLGDQFSLVDITLIPWALRLFLIDHYKKPDGVGIPDSGRGGEDEEVWNRWRVWKQAVRNRDSVTSTLSEREKYIEVYKRYAEDETGSQVGQATRGGRSMP